MAFGARIFPEANLKKLITGNEAVALGAVRAGVRVVTGYPGTPSTGALESLLRMDIPDIHGGIGCTILGTNPPLETIWSEISMGASVSYAQGFVYRGVITQVIATIGDSTFFMAGSLV